MGRPIWKQDRMSAFHHRLFWWMLDAGAAQNPLPWGWTQAASRDLLAHEETVKAGAMRLVQMRLLVKTGKGRYALDPDALQSGVDEEALRRGTA